MFLHLVKDTSGPSPPPTASSSTMEVSNEANEASEEKNSAATSSEPGEPTRMEMSDSTTTTLVGMYYTVTITFFHDNND